MNWDQIEAKWAAMARRVRSDLPEMTQARPDEDVSATPQGEFPEPSLPEVAEVDAE